MIAIVVEGGIVQEVLFDSPSNPNVMVIDRDVGDYRMVIEDLSGDSCIVEVHEPLRDEVPKTLVEDLEVKYMERLKRVSRRR